MASLANSFEQSSGISRLGQPGDPILFQRADGIGLHAEIGNRRLRARRHGIHHAGLGENVNDGGEG